MLTLQTPSKRVGDHPGFCNCMYTFILSHQDQDKTCATITHKVNPAQYIGRRRKTLIRIDELPIPLKLPLLQQYMMQMKVIEAGVIMQGNPKQD